MNTVSSHKVRLRPDILLVLVTRPHGLDNVLRLLLRDAPLFRDDLAEQRVDLAGHIGCVTAHVEVRLLLEQLVDLGGHLFELVLHVDLVGTFTRKRGGDFKFIAKIFLVLLENPVSLARKHNIVELGLTSHSLAYKKSSSLLRHPKKRRVLPTFSPFFACWALSCTNARNGATPVPGPTIMIGFDGSEGSLKLECLT